MDDASGGRHCLIRLKGGDEQGLQMIDVEDFSSNGTYVGCPALPSMED